MEEKNPIQHSAFFDTRIPGDEQAFYARGDYDILLGPEFPIADKNPEMYPASKDFYDTRASFNDRMNEKIKAEKLEEIRREEEVRLWREEGRDLLFQTGLSEEVLVVKSAEMQREEEVKQWRLEKKKEKRRNEEREISQQIKARKENRKQAQQETYQSWLKEQTGAEKSAEPAYAYMPQPHSKYVKEKLLMLDEKELDVNETKEGQERLVDDLLQKTKVDKAKKESFVQYGVLSYMVKDQSEYKMFVLDYYCDKTLPAELQSKYKNKELKAEKTEYVSPSDLQRQLIEMQIAATMADNALHVCVDISSVPETEAKTYRDQVIAGLNSENFAKENYTIICANKTQADALSTPLLKCNYL